MNDLADILTEELEGKQDFEAYTDTDCDGCGGAIFQGDTFYFFGNKRKICTDCYSEICNLAY